jgi:Protein of unknown function (DUF3027)
LFVTSIAASVAAGKIDQVCAVAVDVARAAILNEHVAGHAGAMAEGDRTVTHFFECTLPGYHGWRWAVTVARAPRSRHVTVSETVLLPGDEALLAPSWVPWRERLQPGDLGVGDLLPTRTDDDRLAPGYVLSDDPAVEDASWELGLGRPRVLSRQGRAEAAQRWYDGEHGPEAAISTAAPRNARCGTCGFYLPLAGSLRQAFGVCGNVFAPDDGRAVSADHGCGAHSEVLIEAAPPVEELPTVFDDSELEAVTTSHDAVSVAEADPGPAEADPGPAEADPGPAEADPGPAEADPGPAEADPGSADAHRHG